MQERSNLAFLVVNFFTFFRILVFPFVLVLILNGGVVNILVSFLLFVFGAFTDAFDGMLARKYKVSSKFGFILDPIADKFLVLGTLLAMSLVDYLMIPLWCFFVILFRDILVSVLKPISDKLGFPIPTTFFAKLKTTTQFVGIIFIFVYMFLVNIYKVDKIGFEGLLFVPYYIVLVLVVITVISGFEYVFLFLKGLLNVRGK